MALLSHAGFAHGANDGRTFSGHDNQLTPSLVEDIPSIDSISIWDDLACYRESFMASCPMAGGGQNCHNAVDHGAGLDPLDNGVLDTSGQAVQAGALSIDSVLDTSGQVVKLGR